MQLLLARDGHSLQSPHELDLQFVRDMHDISGLYPDPEVRDLADEILNEARDAFDSEGGLTPTHLTVVAENAELLLSSLGYTIEHTAGGYRITEPSCA